MIDGRCLSNDKSLSSSFQEDGSRHVLYTVYSRAYSISTLYNGIQLPRTVSRPCMVYSAVYRIQRYTAVYSGIQYTAIQRYTVYSVYTLPLNASRADTRDARARPTPRTQRRRRHHRQPLSMSPPSGPTWRASGPRRARMKFPKFRQVSSLPLRIGSKNETPSHPRSRRGPREPTEQKRHGMKPQT